MGGSAALDLPTVNADVAQLVARNLAKVQVAGSNPVVRSNHLSVNSFEDLIIGGMAERRGKGLQIPLHGFKSRSDLHFLCTNVCSGEWSNRLHERSTEDDWLSGRAPH